MKRSMLVALAPVVLGACTMGPDYQRPEMDTPADFRSTLTPATAESLGNVTWWTLFTDETLQQLVRTALADNYDVQVAAARILEARAQLAITGSFQAPTVDGRASAEYSTTDGDRPGTDNREAFSPLGAIDFLFEVDLWGRLRRATEASRAELLATEEARRFVITTLVSDVASAYFSLRSLDEELEVSRATLESRRLSLDLVQRRQRGAVAGDIDVRQAEILVSQAAESVYDTERQIVQLENFISVLLGHNPDAVPRGRTLDQQVTMPELPTGMPSELLERRADVRFAEETLHAATARIGVAKADYFPRLSITASAAIAGLYTHPSLLNDDGDREKNSFGPFGIFSAAPVATLPIFNAGRVEAGVSFAEARAQEALLQYRQVVLEAFREVADAIIEIQKRRQLHTEQEALAVAARDAARLSNIRYKGGVTSYLEVLDSERQQFDADLGLVRTRRDELLAIVRLYKALGGGWQPEVPAEDAQASADEKGANAGGSPSSASGPQSPTIGGN